MPTSGQMAVLAAAILFFAAGGGISLWRLGRPSERLRLAAKSCLYFGLTAGLVVLGWHSARRGGWMPIRDNFDVLVWLAMLLALFVLYVQRRRPLGGLDWFVMPISIVLLIGAMIFGYGQPRQYSIASAWTWVHVLSACAGVVFFCIAGAVGAMYLVSNHRLRSATVGPGPNLGSLERLERLTFSSITLGFALLTLSMVVGIAEVVSRHEGAGWLGRPKVLLGLGAWAVYAAVLYTPINPSLRGRKTAVLSLVGLALMIGAFVAVEYGGGAL